MLCTHTYSPVVKLAAWGMYCLLVTDRYYKNLYIKNTEVTVDMFKFCVCVLIC